MRDLKALGHIPDTAEKAKRFPLMTVADVTSLTDAAVPPSADNSALEGSILDQNETGSCTGHGSSQWLLVSYAFQGRPLPFRPSPKGIYDCTRDLDRAAATPTGELPPLTDSGGMPADIVVAISAMGIRPLVMPSPQGFASDIDTSNCNVEEKLGEFEHAANTLLDAARRIDPSQPDFVTNLCAAIAATGAVGVGVFVDTAFEQYNPANGPLTTCNTSDPNGGGHWLCIDKFETQADGTIVFTGPNSWTAQWGDKGHFSVTGAWMVQSCSDCYAIFLPKAS